MANEKFVLWTAYLDFDATGLDRPVMSLLTAATQVSRWCTDFGNTWSSYGEHLLGIGRA